MLQTLKETIANKAFQKKLLENVISTTVTLVTIAVIAQGISFLKTAVVSVIESNSEQMITDEKPVG